jgi:nicotinamidase-related amidase
MKYTDPDLRNSALLTIDVQRDFSLAGAPAEIPGTMDVVPNIVRLLNAYRASGRPIVHMVRLYLGDGSNVDLCRRELIQSGKEIVRPGSAGAQLVQELLPTPDVELKCSHLLEGGIQTLGPNEVVIYKPRWGAFFGTPLYDHLNGLQIKTLLVCGCNFPNCPRTTIYEASERDFRLVLVKDGVSGIYQKGREELWSIGVHLWSTGALD